MKKTIFYILIFIKIAISEEIGPLIINEIFPFNSKYGEWIELKNYSNSEMNLKGWQISDPKKSAVLTYNDFYVKPNEVILIVMDEEKLMGYTGRYLIPESWITLNNDSDTLKLILPYSSIFSDVVYYKKSWFNNEKHSLKRIDKNQYAITEYQWSSTYPSPGFDLDSQLNIKNSGGNKSLTISSMILTPNNDGTDDFLTICSRSSFGEVIKISIYDFSGRIKFFKTVTSGDLFHWDGMGEGGEKLKNGPFFVVAEFEDGYLIKRRFVLWS